MGAYPVNRSGLQSMIDKFGERLGEKILLARYTASRVGGPADFLLEVNSAEELSEASRILWAEKRPFSVLGGGSNVLVSDAGIRGVVLINRAKEIRFETRFQLPTVWAESGANFGVVSRQAASRGLSGLEWAAGIPGSLGGAVVGNAGAHGGDMAASLLVADILHSDHGRELWPVDRLGYQYRSSVLKSSGLSGEGALAPQSPQAVVLAALLRLENSDPQSVQEKINDFVGYRRQTQPPGASMGSMFKNPPGDYAGRLIEAAGLKGTRIGDAQISILHGNFFINLGGAAAMDVYGLIQHARRAVLERFGVRLELEVELIGEWHAE
jgi:UDP-N-acetylmuramate dehydrogenase